ncbi:hypothetical protein [Streptomyces edwardsiae]|uniref:Uncharacterized protein n=1 Tax=Streptomyces edwardsiae TaxID=3075527 RepID=A0ABU2QPE2_9ACTN|nr:hypothetical protein [Streptomyces sp. DSM 41635]MDT0405724.1 hypothetical protein [Streptomyces sp. DSM 41635]
MDDAPDGVLVGLHQLGDQRHPVPAGRGQQHHWLTRHADRLTDDQAPQLKEILARCPALGHTAHHVRASAELMNNRQGRHPDQWMTQWRPIPTSPFADVEPPTGPPGAAGA